MLMMKERFDVYLESTHEFEIDESIQEYEKDHNDPLIELALIASSLIFIWAITKIARMIYAG